jgi:L-lactate dehydrogenase complex protein LldG
MSSKALNSKEQILSTLRRDVLPPVALPELSGEWLTFEHPREQFAQILAAVGGQAIAVPSVTDLPQALARIETFATAERIWSLVPGVPSCGGTWEVVSDPHDLESLDYCVAPGHFGVAENAAVWVSQADVPLRASLVIPQHLVLVVPAGEIVSNMREAYARLTPGEFPFGVFISGPSKTADIEQSLVIGAHGARSMTVVLLGAERI